MVKKSLVKKTSIQDVANRLGVSKAVVSFVLNGKGREKRISEQTIENVFKVARELNYKPNHISKWFRTGKTQTIGLIIADISNPFFGKLGKEIEKEAYRNNYKIIICSSDENPEKSGRQLEMLKSSMVDGVIIAPPPGSSDQIKLLQEENVPYVLIDRYFPEMNSNYVIIDNYKASYDATKYLFAKGFQNVAFLTVNNELVTMQDRTNGYMKAVGDFGRNLSNPIVYKLPFSHEKKEVESAIRHIISLNKKVEAILFASSKIGFMGLEVIANLGLRIPEDIAVISFDDPDYYKICYSPVTAIGQPLDEMGKSAVQILIEMLSAEKMNESPRNIVLDTNFVLRKSSG